MPRMTETFAVRAKTRLRRLVMRTRRRAGRTLRTRRPMAWTVLRLTVAPAVFARVWPRCTRVSRIARRALRESGAFAQRADGRGVELQPFAALDRGRHRNDAVARANQAADHDPQCLEQAPHFAVATLAEHDAIPVVRCIIVAAGILDRLTARDAVFERDAR